MNIRGDFLICTPLIKHYIFMKKKINNEIKKKNKNYYYFRPSDENNK